VAQAGTVRQDPPARAIVIDIQQVWSEVSPDGADPALMQVYLAKVREIVAARHRPGAPYILTGRGPIWLYLSVAHELHGHATQLWGFDPKLGYILIYGHGRPSVRAPGPATERFISEYRVGQVLAEILKQQQAMYQEYLQLKRRQVELLEQGRGSAAD